MSEKPTPSSDAEGYQSWDSAEIEDLAVVVPTDTRQAAQDASPDLREIIATSETEFTKR